MRKQTLAIVTALLLGIFLAGPMAQAAEVAQGKCVAYSAADKKITIEEYDINFSKQARYGNPTGIISEFDLTHAKVGIPPQPGDVVRIAYNVEGDKKAGLKVMNVSKQDLMKK